MPYEHQPERVHIAKNFKDEEGAVITQPRNFMTSPPKLGRVGKGTSFAGPTPHMVDDYDRPKMLAHKEYLYHHSKLQDKPFSPLAAKLKNGVFNQSKQLYDICETIKKPPAVQREINKVDHERAFRPSQPGKKGPHATIDKFPEY